MSATFHLELPPICNQECVFCVISAKKNPRPRIIDVETQTAKAVAATEPGDYVFVGGWEPTYWTNLPDLYRSLAATGRNVYVNTNGSAPDVLEELFRLGMKKAVVSFFSSERKVHDLVTRSDHFPLLERSLAVCSQPWRSLHVNYVVTRFNQDRIVTDVEYLLDRYRPVSVTFQPIVLFWRAVASARISVPDMAKSALSVNRALVLLRERGVKERKVAFYPHCLLDEPGVAENALVSNDEVRKKLLEKVSKTSPDCASCSRLWKCSGIPEGYANVSVRPFRDSSDNVPPIEVPTMPT